IVAAGALATVSAAEDDWPGGATACGAHAATGSPVPASPEVLRKSRLFTEVTSRRNSTFDCAQRQAANERALDKRKKQQDRRDADDAAGRQQPPRQLVFADHQLQTDRPGANPLARSQHEREQELVPR